MSVRDLIEANMFQREGGDPEVKATWVAEHRGELRLVDVREPHELQGPLGAVDGVENVPLLEVLGQVDELSKGEPVVLICRSGRRSGLAAKAIRDKGGCAVSVEGGMIAWDLDVEGRQAIAAEEKAANTAVLGEAVYRTNGLPEVSSHWVSRNLGRFRLIDVREPAELQAHGRVVQAENIPLGMFLSFANGLERDAPIVVMCASGGRSGRAVQALEGAGFTACASMEGGMFGWRAQGLPTA